MEALSLLLLLQWSSPLQSALLLPELSSHCGHLRHVPVPLLAPLMCPPLPVRSIPMTSLLIARPTGHHGPLLTSQQASRRLFLLVEMPPLQAPRILCSHSFLLLCGCAGSSPLLTSLHLSLHVCLLAAQHLGLVSVQSPRTPTGMHALDDSDVHLHSRPFPRVLNHLVPTGHPKVNRPQPNPGLSSADQQVFSRSEGGRPP